VDLRRTLDGYRLDFSIHRIPGGVDMQGPLVTIITPTYNHARWLPACLDSVLGQTYQSWELIIVDDASVDHTEDIVREYCRADTRIAYVRHPVNYGPWRLAETYNDALHQAHGDFVAILEGDDLWPSDKLQTQVQWHMDDPLLRLSCGTVQQIGETSTIFRIPKKYRGIITTDALLKGILLREIFPGPVTTMISRPYLQSIGGFQSAPMFPATDLPTFLKLLAGQGHARCENIVLGYWRTQPEQVTQHYFETMDAGGLQLKLDTVRESGLAINPSLVKRAHHPVSMRTQFRHLRRSLKEHDQATAYHLAWRLLLGGSVKQRVVAVYAFILAFVGSDMERLIHASLWIKHTVINRHQTWSPARK
jgi:glycosyltransferase involved in cell wall biosynthesis